jgi:branched-chain amino acid transport system permease protein
MQTLLSGQLLFAALVTGAAYALVALGLNLVYGTMRLLNVAHGEIVMLGAYVTFWLFSDLAVPPPLALLASTAAAALLGAAVYHGLLRRMLASPRLKGRVEANSLLLFFGVSIILQNLAALIFDATPQAYRYLDGVIRLGDVAMTGNRLLLLLVAAGLCIAVAVFLRLSIHGLAIKALIQHREAAAVVGIGIERIQLASVCLGFGLAGLAGSLVSMTEQISPFMGFPFTIAAFVVVILGGLGNLVGGMAAGLLLGAIETYGVALTSASLRSVLLYGVFIAVLLLRPQGLLGGARMAR